MSNRTLLILAGLLILFGAVAWLPSVLPRTSAPGIPIALQLSAQSLAQVQAIDVHQAKDHFHLSRSGTGWQIDGEPVLHDMADNLTRAFSGATTPELLSRSADAGATYGFTGAQPLSFTLVGSNGTGATLAIGSKKPEIPGSFYLKLQNAPEVYRMGGILGPLMHVPRGAWWDPVILQIDPKTVQSIALTQSGATTTLQRSGSGWSMLPAAPGKDVSSLASSMLQALNPLSAQAPALPTQRASFAAGKGSVASVELMIKGSASVRLKLLKLMDGTWLVQKPGAQNVYVITAETAKGLLP